MGIKQAIILRSDLGMGKGKIVTQGAHASLTAFREAEKKNTEDAERWEAEGQKKITLKVGSEKELMQIYSKAKRKKLPISLICDAGLTQLEPGSATAVAIGPADEKKIDVITGKLKLL